MTPSFSPDRAENTRGAEPPTPTQCSWTQGRDADALSADPILDRGSALSPLKHTAPRRSALQWSQLRCHECLHKSRAELDTVLAVDEPIAFSLLFNPDLPSV